MEQKIPCGGFLCGGGLNLQGNVLSTGALAEVPVLHINVELDKVITIADDSELKTFEDFLRDKTEIHIFSVCVKASTTLSGVPVGDQYYFCPVTTVNALEPKIALFALMTFRISNERLLMTIGRLTLDYSESKTTPKIIWNSQDIVLAIRGDS